MRKRHWGPWVAALWIGLIPVSASAKVLLNERGELGPEGHTKHESFFFDLPSGDVRIVVSFAGSFSSGKGSVKFVGAKEEVLAAKDFETGRATLLGTFGPFPEAGRARFEFSVQEGAGEWQGVVAEIPEKRDLYPLLLAGPLMMFVALAFAVGWWWRTRVPWRWFWLGAGLWALGVALKIAWAILMNPIILTALKPAVSYRAYLIIGGFYVGSLTGVFEIGIVVLWALIWRKKVTDAPRAIAVGIGAGAFEALALGLAGAANAATMIFVPLPEQAQAAMYAAAVPLMATTPLLWLCSPVERVLAILCHVASRALVLLGVAARRMNYLWRGFLLLTLLDTVAGVALLAELPGKISMWWIELALLPFALISVLIVPWSMRAWPEPALPPELPELPAE